MKYNRGMIEALYQRDLERAEEEYTKLAKQAQETKQKRLKELNIDNGKDHILNIINNFYRNPN